MYYLYATISALGATVAVLALATGNVVLGAMNVGMAVLTGFVALSLKK